MQLGRMGPSYMWWELMCRFKNNEVTSCMSTCPWAMVAYPIVHVWRVCVESKILKFHFWVKSDTAVLTFTLCFLWFPLLLLSLPRFSLFFCHLLGIYKASFWWETFLWESFQDSRVRWQESQRWVGGGARISYTAWANITWFFFFSLSSVTKTW